jgi:hypothetical protein
MFGGAMKQHLRCLWIVTLGLGFLHNPTAYSQDKQRQRTIRAVFEIQPAESRIVYEGESEYLELQYDPSNDIISGLQRAGFTVVTDGSADADMVATVRHKEVAYARRSGREVTSQTVAIDSMMFRLTDADSNDLLTPVRFYKFDYARGAYHPDWVDMAKIKETFVNNLVELVAIRSEEDDETSAWIEFVRRRGERATVREIHRAADSSYNHREEQLRVLVPLLELYLRSHELRERVVAASCLQEFDWTPTNMVDSAAFSIIDTYPYEESGVPWGDREHSPDAWAAKQGVIPVMKYGTLAIDFLIEDLEGFRVSGRDVYGLRDGDVPTRAKAILERLSKENWNRFRYPLRPRGEVIDTNPGFETVEYYVASPLRGINIPHKRRVEAIRTTEVFSDTWSQHWNDHAIERLVDILETGRTTGTDSDYLREKGISNRDYFKDVIEILGAIGDSRAIEVLRLYVDHSELGKVANEAIAQIRDRSGMLPDTVQAKRMVLF